MNKDFVYEEQKQLIEIWKSKYYEQKEEIEKLNNKEEQLIRRLEDLIIIGEQVENEWAVDICKMIIKELKGKKKIGEVVSLEELESYLPQNDYEVMEQDLLFKD